MYLASVIVGGIVFASCLSSKCVDYMRKKTICVILKKGLNTALFVETVSRNCHTRRSTRLLNS